MPEKKFDTEDPMEMIGIVIPGDSGTTDEMASVFIEEFIRMGWKENKLMGLFTNPLYMATHRIYLEKGDKYVRQLILQNLEKWRPKQNIDTGSEQENQTDKSNPALSKE